MASNRLATWPSYVSVVEFAFEGLCGFCPVLHPITVTEDRLEFVAVPFV